MMKYIITERQLKSLMEQSDYAMDRRGNALLNTTGLRSDKDYKETNQIINKAQAGNSLDPHTLMTILQIGTTFIPYIGPFISAGIGLADAATYYNEGDKKTAGLIALFSMIPGVGGLATKLGLGKWSANALGEIGKKISLGSKLTPVESQVANRVVQYRQLIQNEMSKLGKQATIQSGKNAAKKQVAKSNFIKGTTKVGSQIGGYAATGYLYNKGYDKITGQQELNLTSINPNKISQENKTAAASIKFD